MREKDIQAIIDRFNKKEPEIKRYCQQIGRNVLYGLIWTSTDFSNLRNNTPYIFYFITSFGEVNATASMAAAKKSGFTFIDEQANELKGSQRVFSIEKYLSKVSLTE